MGIRDKAEEVVIGLVAAHIVDGARWLANKLLGGQGDDTTRDKIARAAIAGAAAAAQQELLERAAANNLDNFARQVLGEIAAIDVDALFATKNHGHAGAAEVVILEPNRDGPYRTLGEELAEAQAERAALEKEGK